MRLSATPAVAAACLLLAASGTSAINECSGDKNKDSFPERVTVSSMSNSGFAVEYRKWFKFVFNEFTNERYILYCGDTKPTEEEFKDLAKESEIKSFIKIPADNVAAQDPTALSFMEALQIPPDTVKFVHDSEAVTAAYWLATQNSKLPPLEDATPEQREKLDLVFVDGSNPGDTDFKKGVTLWHDKKVKLDPLVRAQWIKYVAVFFNAETKANEIFNTVFAEYRCHEKNLSKLKNRKKIAWVAKSSSQFEVYTDKYYAELMRDAGFDPKLPSATTFATGDNLNSVIGDVDYLIDSTPSSDDISDFQQWLTKFGYGSSAQSSNVNFIANKQVWRTDKRVNEKGFSDWEQAVGVRPDLALLDLIDLQGFGYIKSNTSSGSGKASPGSVGSSGYVRRWLRNFSKGDDSDKITGEDAKIKPLLAQFRVKCQDQEFIPDKVEDTAQDGTKNNPDTTTGDSKDPTNTNIDSNTGSSVSKTVGPIVGVIVAIGIIAGVLFYIRRRNIKKRQAVVDMITLRANMSSPTNEQYIEFPDENVRR
ncbi:hypothetical protein GQ42DRAFT_40016 [Ramicandelaber brevisporus]|nr:hypothetical protein GQ42DRAFT_40016 [Ramicandelaber brevisporus]